MRKLVQWLVAGMLTVPGPLMAQSTLQHAAKVQIKPNQSTTYADAVRVWGGGQFGAGGAVQTINIDGTLNINSTTVPSGVITFAMWDDNGCSFGQIPKYNGSAWVCDTDIVGSGGGGGTLSSISLVMPAAIFDISPGTLTADGTFTVTFDTQTANTVFAGPSSGSAAAPAFRALVAADLPTAVTQTSDNEVITGSWRFSANTLFGDSTTAQQLVHIYKSSAQAGLSIEKGDETERWDILANTSGLQIVEATGGLVPLTFKANRIGIFNNSPTSGYEVDLTGDFKLSGNVSVGGYFENSLLPATNDTYNLGGLNLRWANAWISQINATIFAEATAQLFGGYSVIGKNAGKFAASSGPTDATINLDKSLTVPSWIVIQAHDQSGATTPKIEYITLTSAVGACTGSGATLNCEYNVTRDATGLHTTDPDWPDGTPFLWLGVQGDGRIELYAYNGLPRIGVLLQGATPQSGTEIVRLGGLDGMPTMSSVPGRYGLFIGEGSTAYLKYQKQTSGSPSGDDEKLIVRGTIQATAGEFGSNASNLVSVSSEGLDVGTGAVHGGKTSYTSSTAGFWLGNDGGTYKLNLGDTNNYVKWTGTALDIRGNLNASDIVAGTLTGINISGGTITGSVVQTAASGPRIVLDTTPVLAWYSATGEIGRISYQGIEVTPSSTVLSNSAAYKFTNGSGGSDDIWGMYAYNDVGTRYLRLTADTITAGKFARSFLEASCGGSCGSNLTYLQLTADATSRSAVLITDTFTISGDTTVTGTFIAGGSNDFSVDDVTHRIGINDVTPSYTLDVNGTGRFTGAVQFDSTVNVNNAFSVNGSVFYVDTTTSRVGISDTTPSYVLDVNGTGRFVGNLLLDAALTGSGTVNIDSGTLYVDVTNNRVGINKTSPTVTLDVGGAINADTSNGIMALRDVSTTGIEFHIRPDVNKDAFITFTEDTDTDKWVIEVLNSNTNLVFATGSAASNTDRITFSAAGNVNAATFSAAGAAGISATFNPTTCTSMTFTGGILTAKAGC